MGSPRRFVSGTDDLNDILHSLKLIRCPHCGAVETLNGHGFLTGYSETGTGRIVRGRRFFCSNRFRRRGCGKTFSVLLSHLIVGFLVSATTLLRFLRAVLDGASRKVAWERVSADGLCIRSGYRLWSRLVLAQPHLRTWLCRSALPPTCVSTHPMAQVLAQLDVVFPDVHCAFSGFQNQFQVGLLG